MRSRIDFPATSFDHIEFERKLIENGISYVKSDGFLFRDTPTITFNFEEKDYEPAVKIADLYSSAWFDQRGIGTLNSVDQKLTSRILIISVIVIAIIFLILKVLE